MAPQHPQSTIPVLIVGAGPAGLVAALALAQNGIKVRIIDKGDSFRVGSRGFGVQPRTFELFQSLGFNDEVQKHATPIPTMRAYKLPGGTVPAKTWDLYEKRSVWPDRPHANGMCLSQTKLEEIMRVHLAKYGVSVELSKGLVAIQQDADTVTATLAIHKDGTPTAEQETVIAQYLVGSDGAKGVTRKILGLTFQGETRDADGMVWGDVEIRGLSSDYWHIWGKPGHFTIMARPLSQTGNTFGIGITGQNFDPTELADPARTIQFIHTETGRTDLEFGEFSWLSYFKPNMRMVNKFQEGRAFVIGDAAHVHSPTGGQGMNCSVQDATNLSWKLAYVLHGHAPPALLASYTTERLPVITQMLHATTALYTHTVAQAKTQDAPEGAEKGEDEKASGWFRWRNDALELYGINYRFSSIIQDERTPVRDEEDARARAYAGYEGGATLCAGDRAPEAPGLLVEGRETTLFELLRPSVHTVLIFPEEGKVEVESVERVVGRLRPHIVQTVVLSSAADREGHAHRAYRVEGAEKRMTVVVVRPDGFVGAVVRGAAGVQKYFEGILGPI